MNICRHLRFISAIWLLSLITIGHLQAQRDIWGEYNIGLLGNAETDPIFKAIKAGAEQAVYELELKYKLDLTLSDKTPRYTDHKKQIHALKNFYVDQVAGVLLIPAHPNLLKENINFLVERDISVMTVGKDVPASMRTATWIMDESASARMATEACIRALGKRGGNIAVLVGKHENPIQTTRLQAALAAIKVASQAHVHEVYVCNEDLSSALAVVESALMTDRNDQIDAWLFLGEWPLAGAAPLPWDTQKIPCTAIGALPPMLPYIQRKEVALLVAQDYHRWGYESMYALIEQIHQGTLPEKTIHYGIPQSVTKKNLQEHWDDWVKWNQ